MAHTYEPNWESLKQYSAPPWFRDAKLGIFVHWGVYSVPAFGNEWYPRNMYREGTPEFAHHRATWGPQARFGYKDFIPLFRGERYDPAAWVALCQEAGARYIVPVAEHHDGFPMFASAHTPWNAAKMGPKRDIVTELGQAVRGAGLKFGVSSHRAFNWRYYRFGQGYDTDNPENVHLYGRPHAEDAPADDAFLADWFSRVQELVDRFDPDVLWFDFGWHQPEYDPFRPRVAAYYYNRAAERGYEPVLQYKDKFPDGAAVWDMERGKLDRIHPYYWQTDTSVSYKSWGYVHDDEFKSVTTLVHDLVDIVSKNGNLLLNVGPAPDGTIPEAAQERLRRLGQWLRVNGEAIYDTRHWETFGEGETTNVVGHLTERQNAPYTAQDIRFTTRGETLYATLLGWPQGEALVRSLGADSSLSGRIRQVTLLGDGRALAFKQDAAGLHVTLPERQPCEHAWVLKVE
jgi:alpha-L-fucosidase